MNFYDLPPDMGKHLAGPAGSAIALLWLKTTWYRGICMFAAGWALSVFCAPSVATWLNLAQGFTGFLLGLFGIAVVDKLFDTWNRFDASTLLVSILKKWGWL